MATLMLVNPRKRGKKKMATRKRRTPAQIRATKKLVAFNKRRGRKAPARKRKTPTRRKVAVTALSRTTRRKPTARLKARRRKNISHKMRGYYPNPSRRSAKMSIKNVINQQIKPAAIQASGALVLDVGYGYLGGYIPDMLNTGMVKHATKGVVAIALGMIASNFVKNASVNQMVLGAMTVTMHDAMKEALQTYAPSVPMGYYSPSPTYGDMGYIESNAGSAYTDTNLGYFESNPGTAYGTQSETFDTSAIEG